jgi:hypothetical protein
MSNQQDLYYTKYLKYKEKYLRLQNQMGSGLFTKKKTKRELLEQIIVYLFNTIESQDYKGYKITNNKFKPDKITIDEKTDDLPIFLIKIYNKIYMRIFGRDKDSLFSKLDTLLDKKVNTEFVSLPNLLEKQKTKQSIKLNKLGTFFNISFISFLKGAEIIQLLDIFKAICVYITDYKDKIIDTTELFNILKADPYKVTEFDINYFYKNIIEELLSAPATLPLRRFTPEQKFNVKKYLNKLLDIPLYITLPAVPTDQIYTKPPYTDFLSNQQDFTKKKLPDKLKVPAGLEVPAGHKIYLLTPKKGKEIDVNDVNDIRTLIKEKIMNIIDKIINISDVIYGKIKNIQENKGEIFGSIFYNLSAHIVTMINKNIPIPDYIDDNFENFTRFSSILTSLEKNKKLYFLINNNFDENADYRDFGYEILEYLLNTK